MLVRTRALVFFAFGLALASCARAPATPAISKTGFPLLFENCGRPVSLALRPHRVLTIGTPGVDAIYRAGVTGVIAARAGEYGVPATGDAGAAAAKAPILAAAQPSLESMIGARIDMVIGYGLGQTTDEALTGAGISHYILSGNCGTSEAGTGTGSGVHFENIYNDVRFLGRVFGTQALADAAAARLSARVEAVRRKRSAGIFKTAAVVFFIGDQKYTYGRLSTSDEQLKALGLTNALEDINRSNGFNIEALIDANPDVIVLVYGYQPNDSFEKAKAQFLSLSGVGKMAAVKNGVIVGVTGPESEASPLAIDGLERLAGELRTENRRFHAKSR
jgi:iron complex transport system substrate-binding protein